MRYKVVLSFKSVYVALVCDHYIQSKAIEQYMWCCYYAVQYGFELLVCEFLVCNIEMKLWPLLHVGIT